MSIIPLVHLTHMYRELILLLKMKIKNIELLFLSEELR